MSMASDPTSRKTHETSNGKFVASGKVCVDSNHNLYTPSEIDACLHGKANTSYDATL
jgi:hypothetical protein